MTALEILFVDDDREILTMVEEYFDARGLNISTADSGIAALELIRQRDFDVVFTDFKMPQLNGLQLLRAIKAHRPATEVVMVTGYATTDSAVEAMKSGCFDYLQKPFRLERLHEIVEGVKARRSGAPSPVPKPVRHRLESLLGVSACMQTLFGFIEALDGSEAHVLLQGESGTGKQLAARVIQQRSSRRERPFVPVTCRLHKNGMAGTAAETFAERMLEDNRGGTVFLDEVCALPLEVQRVLAQRLSAATTPDTPRVLAATAEDLAAALAQGRLSPNLMDRLGQSVLRLAPLRERREDVSLLALSFLARFRPSGRPGLVVAPATLDLLLRYSWPGNVIQLENVIQRAYALQLQGEIQVEDLPEEIRTFGALHQTGAA
jgi:DNA-binding NtrC family response regulator